MNETTMLLDKIEQLVLDSFKFPIVNRVLMHEDKFFELFDRLRQQLPVEFEQAKQIVAHKTAIMVEAQRRAEQIVTNAEKKAKMMLEEQTIVTEARSHADSLLKRGTEEAFGQMDGADHYADDVLSSLENNFGRILTTIQNGRREIASRI